MSKRLTIEEFIETLKQGGSGGGEPLTVHETNSGSRATFDKTWQEIYDAFAAGRVVLVIPAFGVAGNFAGAVVGMNGYDGGSHTVAFWRDNALTSYNASSADDYPYHSYD